MPQSNYRLGLLAAAIFGVALAGCASNEPQTAAAPAPAPAPAPAAAPAPPPPAAPAAMPMRRHMSHNEFVSSVQTALNSNGAQLAVDGRMGPKTAAALRSYQRAHHLHVTGHPDRATVKALGLAG